MRQDTESCSPEQFLLPGTVLGDEIVTEHVEGFVKRVHFTTCASLRASTQFSIVCASQSLTPVKRQTELQGHLACVYLGWSVGNCPCAAASMFGETWFKTTYNFQVVSFG